MLGARVDGHQSIAHHIKLLEDFARGFLRAPAANLPWSLQDLIDYSWIFGVSGVRSGAVAAMSTLLQRAYGRAYAATYYGSHSMLWK